MKTFLKLLSIWNFLKSYEISESFEIVLKFWNFFEIIEILKFFEIFENFWKFWNLMKFLKVWNFIKILLKQKYFEIFKFSEIENFWQFWIFLENFDLFCNLIGRLEMKSRLWMDNVETRNRPPEAHARWTHSEVQPRKYCLGQSAESKIPYHLIKRFIKERY
jgi:hypothetical protein